MPLSHIIERFSDRIAVLTSPIKRVKAGVKEFYTILLVPLDSQQLSGQLLQHFQVFPIPFRYTVQAAAYYHACGLAVVANKVQTLEIPGLSSRACALITAFDVIRNGCTRVIGMGYHKSMYSSLFLLLEEVSLRDFTRLSGSYHQRA